MKEKKNLLWTLGISLIYWIIVSLRFDILYALNDDIMMQSILSGGLTGQPSSMAVYMGQPLTGLLALLYSVTKNIPWLGLFLAGCYVLCFTCILYKTLSLGTDKKQRIFGGCAVVLAFTALCLPQYLMIHYTVVAAVVGSTGIFLIGTSNEKEGKVIEGLGAYFLLVLCFLIRKQVFFMLLPFLFGLLFYRILCEKKWKKCLKQVCLCVCIVLFFSVIHELLYSQNGWKEYGEYNAARTDLYDYTGVWEGEAATAYYSGLGLSKEQIEICLAYDIMLDDQLSTERLQEMADFEPGKFGIKSPMAPTFREALWNYRAGLLSRGQDFPYNYLILFLYLGLAVLAFIYKDWISLSITVCFGIGRSAVWMYLLMQGRMPERVSVSLLLIEGASLFCIFRKTMQGKKNDQKLFGPKIIVTFLTLLLPVAAIMNMQTAKVRQDILAKQNESDKVLYDFLAENPGNCYLLDVYATVNRTQYAILDSSGEKENYLMLGGWITESPLVKEKLTAWGYDSASDALLHGENVYFVKKGNAGLKIETLENLFEGYQFELQKNLDTKNGTSFLIYKVSK